ncbi:MAG: hypothetical protein IKV16_04615 [Clostridia bacterium]|nr:hypothetical protein [Clostridia bacterium]
MRPTKRITVSAMATALGSALMAVGAVWELVDMALAALASFLVVIILIEVGSPFPWLVWITTSLATFLFFPGSTVWLMYFVFGVFPILKYYIERLKRPFWFPLKLIYVNACIIGLLYALDFIFGTPLFGTDNLIVKIALYTVLNFAFFAYDRMLTLLIRLYTVKYRQRFRHLFK